MARYPRRSPEEQAEIDAKRKIRPTPLNSGLTPNQIFQIIEDLLRRQRREVVSIGFYAIWRKFLELGREPYNPLLAAKMAKGYTGTMLNSDVEELEGEHVSGVSVEQLGFRLSLVMRTFFVVHLKGVNAKNLQWEKLTPEMQETFCFAAKAIFDWGYEAGYLHSEGIELDKVHKEEGRCTCADCYAETIDDPRMQRALSYMVKGYRS